MEKSKNNGKSWKYEEYMEKLKMSKSKENIKYRNYRYTKFRRYRISLGIKYSQGEKKNKYLYLKDDLRFQQTVIRLDRSFCIIILYL